MPLRQSALGVTRHAGLDELRALAVLLVIGRHFVPTAPLDGVSGAAIGMWDRIGWVGVDLFFVLSGFLVTSLLLREYGRTGSVRPGRFLVRRGLKIYPGFYAFLLITTLFGPHDFVGVTRDRALAEALFLQSYLPRLWQHTWSLAVEEHFYLLLALVAAAVTRVRLPHGLSSRVSVTQILLFLILAQQLLRVLTALSQPLTFRTPFHTHLRLDGLLLGSLIAWLVWRHPTEVAGFVKRVGGLLPSFGACALVAVPLLWDYRSAAMLAVGFSILAFGAAAIMLWVLHQPQRSAGLLATLGAASYSIYLWHLPTEVAVRHALAGTIIAPPAQMVVVLLSTLAVGWGMGRLIELPALALRDRWWPDPAVSHPLTSEIPPPAGPRASKVEVFG